MLLTIMVALTSSSYPLIIKYAADSVEARNQGALPIILLLVVVIAAAKGLFMYLQIVQSSTFIQRMTTDIQRKVFDHIIAADFAVATRTAPGQLLSKFFNDIGQLQMATQTVFGFLEMPYSLKFKEEAFKEWRKLDEHLREQFKKKLAERLHHPRVPASRLSGQKDRYKIKLRNVGYRLVYEVRDKEVVVVVVAVGKRERNAVYKMAAKR